MLEARQDLRFGLHFQLAQLFTQAQDGLFELDQVEAETAHLRFQARAVDRHLTGEVHQIVEQVGADADQLLLRSARGNFVVVELGATLHASACGRPRGNDAPHRLGRKRLGGGLGLARLGRRRGDRCICDIDRWRRRRQLDCRGRAFLGVAGQPLFFASLEDRFESRDRMLGERNRLTHADPLDHAVEAVKGLFEGFDRRARCRALAVDDRLEQRFHGVTQIADRVQTGHAGTALERVQVALERSHRLTILGSLAQASHHAVGMIEDVDTFLDKDIEQFEIHVRQVQRTGRIHVHRSAGGPLGLRLFGLRRPGCRRRGIDGRSNRLQRLAGRLSRILIVAIGRREALIGGHGRKPGRSRLGRFTHGLPRVRRVKLRRFRLAKVRQVGKPRFCRRLGFVLNCFNCFGFFRYCGYVWLFGSLDSVGLRRDFDFHDIRGRVDFRDFRNLVG